MPFRLQHIDHVAIYVKNVLKSIRWYQETLGLERIYEDAWGVQPAVLCAGETCVALFQSGGATGNGESPSVGQRGLSHVAFLVDRRNFQAAREELPARGIEIRQSNHGIADSIYMTDPDGHEIEITIYEM